MVELNRIYTRGGDKGQTSLGDGARVPKTSLRIIAIGSVDELNASLGLARTGEKIPPDLDEQLARIQNDLFDIGADLCVPISDKNEHRKPLRVSETDVTLLEETIDRVNEELQPLKSFILPGGTPVAAALHLSRTVCRRAEIDVLKLAEVEAVNPVVLMYLNRLSDLLFVMARLCNVRQGKGDVLWRPGGESPSA